MGGFPGIPTDVLMQLFRLQQQQQPGRPDQPAEQMSQQGQFNPADIQAQLQGGGSPAPFSFAPVQGGVGRNILNALANAGKAATYVAEDPRERQAEDARAQQLWETKQRMSMAAGEFGQREKDRADQAADRAAQLDIAKKRLGLEGQRVDIERNRPLQEQPHTVDTDKGPIQWDPATRQWSPITIGGKPVGPKTEAKPDTLEQQYDAAIKSGDTVRANQIIDEIDKLTGAKAKPEKPGAGDIGTWSIQQGTDGKPILFNSKTGQTKPAPAGILGKQEQLTPATQGILQTTAPAKDQVQQLISSLDDYIAKKPGNDKTRLTMERLGYALGQESPEADLAGQISKLELNRIVSAARVLKGSSRAYQALQAAEIHAPNPWKDQVGLMRQKLQTILENLNDIEKDAVQFGTKGQTVQQIQGQYGPGSQPGRPVPSQQVQSQPSSGRRVIDMTESKQ